jgi:hypothetical protein
LSYSRPPHQNPRYVTETSKLITQHLNICLNEATASEFCVVIARSEKRFPVSDFPRRQLRLPRHTAWFARSSGLPLPKGPNLGPLIAYTVAKGPIVGDHHPLGSSAGPRKEAKDEIVGTRASRVPNCEPSEVFGVGRSNGRWSIKDQCQTHSPVANRIERSAPHTVPILLLTRQTVEEIIAVNDDRHSG